MERTRRLLAGQVVPARSRAFHVAYEGTPSWETGRSQPVVTGLLAEGAMRGRILDVGCGTGLHAVALAAAGCDVVGIDLVPRAIELATARAEDAALPVRLVVADAFQLPSLGDVLGGPFDTILDVGLFHVLQPWDRAPYAEALAAVTRPGARAYVVAWSDQNPFGIGPGRIRRRDLRAAFSAGAGWRVERIDAARLETLLPMGTVHAWLARLTRR
ncbi:MAG TPA: class I SAM-dependent methyltransferase [Candidatus Limnocylindrales bacterium]|jgi:SAM-dependent methyltransferase